MSGKRRKKKKKTPRGISKTSSHLSNVEEYGYPRRFMRDQRMPSDEPVHPGASILCCRFSPSGAGIATCATDRTARILKYPLSEHAGRGKTLMGHDDVVTNVEWSSDGRHVVTTSDDHTVKIWSTGSASYGTRKAVLTISPNEESKRRTNGGDAHVRDASFFYVDRFVMLACDASVRLYNYRIDPRDQRNDDLKRLRNFSTAELLHRWQHPGAHRITALRHHNNCLSHLTFAATSLRTLCVYNVATETLVREYEDVHSKPVHTVCLPFVSKSISHPQDMYDIVLTVAADSSMRLWDIRSSSRRPVRHFTDGHVNRMSLHHIGAAISPCLRYVCCGSEDGRGHATYDMRSGSCLQSSSHAERRSSTAQRRRDRRTASPTSFASVVSDVSFHPARPILVNARHDGSLHFYSGRHRRGASSST